MILAYYVAFAISLSGLIALFSIKYVELASGRVFFPRTRHVLDMRAESLRIRGLRGVHVVEHLPTYLVAVGYWFLHVFAVLVALSARSVEYQAHRMADFISHRRRFQRRETQSAFLKEVSSHKESLVVPEDVSKI